MISDATSTPRIAHVCIDSPLPHLDRDFEYAVPTDLIGQIRVGSRVKVPFGHRRQLDGWVTALTAVASYDGQLQPIRKVVGRIPPLDPDVWALTRAVADRQAGTAADVLRLAVPPRHARAERTWLTQHAEAAARLVAEPRPDSDGSAHDATELAATWEHPRVHQQPHVGCDLISNNRVVSAWVTDVVGLVREALTRDESTIVAVPDQRDVGQVHGALVERFPDETVARLDGGVDDDARYRSFLDVLGGVARIVVATRSAVYAPAQHLGQLIVVDDGDPSYVEPHAPYAHLRDVALIRQQQSGCRLVFLSSSRSVAVQRLIDIDYVEPGAPVVHPRVIPAAAIWGDDPMLQLARVPQIAYTIARQALASGPVLVQVARAGYQREVATDEGTRSLAGAGRTADELGRAFSGVPVVVATAEQPREQVGASPALVVATAGSEPRCPSGYGAVLLLDALSIVSREGLTASEDAMRHWFAAAALARPDATVVLTGVQGRLADALVQWDAGRFAQDELAQRVALGFPPAVRFFSISTAQGGTQAALEDAHLPEGVEVIQTQLLPGEPGEGEPALEEVTLLRVPFSVGARTAQALKAAVVRATTGPVRQQHRLRVHADDERMLRTS
ncbi:hypothetical protein [Pseudoclavibacter sp. 13-3]|uniref:primosomal protein N' family DNA-binding protein n=1 Tax=Pseudoclavibacter sp. 13-3 TaxID=2901228 RepID=UPI001E3B4D01|nr:hypothetical protein [Pseudoclavibacter sp. 13-3]MCD7101993.1 hypothetical protein [Pseudoclavibacter sp. 13-3]